MRPNRLDAEAAMKSRWLVLVVIAMLAEIAAAQSQPPIGSTPAAPPPAKADRSAVQHGAEPNAGEVRPGNEAGDHPSAAAGALSREQQERRILGLPVTAALVIAGAIVVILVVGGIVLPAARVAERRRAAGGRTAGDSSPPATQSRRRH